MELGLQSDERLEMISNRASQWSLFIMLTVNYVMWIVDNVRAHQAGKEIVFFSTPGILFFTAIAVYLAAFAYSNYRWNLSPTSLRLEIPTGAS